VFLGAVGAGCRRDVSLPPTDAARVTDAIARGEAVVVVEDGEQRKLAEYDRVLVESRPTCETREVVTCNVNQRFSENCTAPPKTRQVCTTPQETFYFPVAFQVTDKDVFISDTRGGVQFSQHDVKRITLRDHTPERMFTVASLALLVGAATAAGAYYYFESTPGERDRGGDGTFSRVLPFAIGAGFGAASIAITVPLTEPEVAASAHAASRPGSVETD
jgi:hypothetical protein